MQLLNASGEVARVVGRNGSAEGEFRAPAGVAVGSQGNILVADSGNDRVQVFSAEGDFVSAFGSSGKDDGEFRGPTGITVDGDGTVYVADSGNGRVQAFDADGTFLATFEPDELKHPFGLAVAPDGSLYVSDSRRHRVLALDTGEGTVLGILGGFGSGEGEFDSPHGLSWDLAARRLYVADTGNDRVQVFGFGTTPTIVTQGAGERPDRLTLPAPVVNPGRGAGAGGPQGVAAPPDVPVSASPPAGSVEAGDLVLSGVTVSPNPVDPRNGEALTVTFTVSKASQVTVVVYDKHQRVTYGFPVQAVDGSGSVQWDGRTQKGTSAPPGFYRVRVLATDGVYEVQSTQEVAVANKGGNVPGQPTPRGRAMRGRR